jgi:putative membrane protein
MGVSDLPLVNASLNFASFVLLSFGYLHIKRGNKEAHRNCMIAAFCTSTLFLISYLYYHAHAKSTRFVDPAWFRPIYLVILLTHTVLATAVVPMVLVTLNRALKARWELHKKIARWTWPVWVYVSVTGVIIYLLLYVIFPQAR